MCTVLKNIKVNFLQTYLFAIVFTCIAVVESCCVVVGVEGLVVVVEIVEIERAISTIHIERPSKVMCS